MTETRDKFFVTTPIYYVNDKPHIGHAYTTIAADVLARLHRQMGEEVFFLTGTDEHGVKIEQAAEKSGKSPKEFTDEVSAKFSFAWDSLDIAPDRFIRTTEPEHIAAVEAALQAMYDSGDIYLSKYEGLYCRGCEQFKKEKDLIDGKCPDHKTVPEKMSEETYVFKMSKYQDQLLEKIQNDELRILPESKKNEILSFYKEQLEDVSFSRKNVKWGIPLPWDKSHTTYVWADAFLNYLTGLGWNGPKGETPDLWPATIQLMSKDILRVHATIWPAMLLSLGLKLPKKLFVHGFFTVGGEKMSKSLGNAIDPNDWVQKFGPDAVRYFLLREVPFGQDGDVSEEKLKARFNGDLANGLGNLFSRVTNMVEKFLDGDAGDYIKSPKDMSDVTEHFHNLEFSEGLVRIWEEVAWANQLIDKSKPWDLVKTEPGKVKELLVNLTALLYDISAKLAPVMPDSANKIRQALEAERIVKAEPLFAKIS
jgi:methionyl-tRNA synthetase